MMDDGSAVVTVYMVIAALLAASWSWRIQARRDARRPKKNNAAGVGPTARSTDGGNRPRHSNDSRNVWE